MSASDTKDDAPEQKVAQIGNITITNASDTPESTPPRQSQMIELSEHKLQPHTYTRPTYCEICTGLLTGIVNQGMQCETCGLNVHPEGFYLEPGTSHGHDCCGEAMLRECQPKEPVSPETEERQRYEETVAAVNEELAQETAREESEKERVKAVTNDATLTGHDSKHPSDDSFIPHISRLLPKDYVEQAHTFEVVSFSAPTKCGVCNGILAGIFRQGKQCKTCGLIIHHGEGAEGHSNCHAEAMLKPCPMQKQDSVPPSSTEGQAPPQKQGKKVSSTGAKKTETDAKSQSKSSGKSDQASSMTNTSSHLPPSIASLPSKILASASSEEEHDDPHKFVEHTYYSPTYCR